MQWTINNGRTVGLREIHHTVWIVDDTTWEDIAAHGALQILGREYLDRNGNMDISTAMDWIGGPSNTEVCRWQPHWRHDSTRDQSNMGLS